MKRGDVAASIFFVVQAAFALYYARHLAPVLPGLGDHYFNIPLSPLTEALQSIRTLGYPLFHAAMARAGWGLEFYPLVQMVLLVFCTAIFALGLRRYGFTGLTALIAASPLLWVVPTDLVMPETPAKCFAIAAIGFLLWAAGSRSPVAYMGLALSVFLACQMRPAFLFLLVFLPLCWLFLYSRRWGVLDPRRWFRNAFATVASCALPLVLFCLLRLVLVGHFGLLSFGGQNTIGISIEMLTPVTARKLPVENRPLAMLMARTREAWPAERFLSARGCSDDWYGIAGQYTVNINRIGRAVQAKFPPNGGTDDNVRQDKALSRMSTVIFVTEWQLYLAWLTGAIVEGSSMAVDLILGGHGGTGFGLRSIPSIALAIIVLCLVIFSWPLTRRAFGEVPRPFSGRAVSVILLVAGLFFLLKMLLVILVEPPIPRYVQAALFLMPSFFLVLSWERCVVLLAALCGRPSWYGQCLVAYPQVPDSPRPIAWRSVVRRRMPRQRTAFVMGAALLLLVALVGWTTRDNRFFHDLAKHPEKVRSEILVSSGDNTRRASDGASVLHYAALQGDNELLAHVLPDVRDVVTQDGATALHWAAMGNGNDTTVVALVKGGLSPNTPGPLGLSAIHLAALFSNESALGALLEQGGDPNLKTLGYVAPLHLVQSTGAASVLLDHGAAVDVPDGSRATPFMWAPTQTLAAFFLERGADINAKEDWRSFIRQATPLHKAAYQGDEARVRWLLEQGANPNQGDINNFSPLFYALWRNNYPLIALLIDHGADVDHPGRWLAYNRENPTFRFTDIYGKTIGRHPKRDSFAKLVPDEVVIRPLDWAAFLGNQELIRALVKRGASLNQHNEAGMSPLHWAVLAQRGKAARLLRSIAPITTFDSEVLSVEAFEAAVAQGHRVLEVAHEPTTTDRRPLPTTTDSERISPKDGLRAAAQQAVEEYNEGAPNILESKEGFLFTRQACQYLLQTDYRYAKPGMATSGPSPAFASIVDIHHQLAARGIHLIVVPAPMAIEVHVDAFYPSWDRKQTAFPPRSDFIVALQEVGVDAIDLLPDFLSYRDTHPASPLYLKEDGHWNSTAIGIAAEVIAKKIRADSITDLGLDTLSYRNEVLEKRVPLPHLVKRLPESRRTPYLDAVWNVIRVVEEEEDTPYRDDAQSPILVVGDSYTLIFNELSGHLSARLAAILGRPVASHLGNAAGPTIPRVLARKGKDYIDSRKVIVWVFSSAYIRPTGKKDRWGLLELP